MKTLQQRRILLYPKYQLPVGHKDDKLDLYFDHSQRKDFAMSKLLTRKAKAQSANSSASFRKDRTKKYL